MHRRATARARYWALGIATALALAGPAAAGDGNAPVCRAPVSLLILDTPEKVAQFAAKAGAAKVAHRDTATVIFADGRVITADAAAAGNHLNALGWSERPIQLVASFPPASQRRPRRGRG